MSFTVEISMPPSANTLFRNVRGKGRVRSAAYVKWARAAVMTIFDQVPSANRISGRVDVEIFLPEKCRMDCDNAIKPLLDALVTSTRIDDDRNVVRVSAWKMRSAETVLVNVTRAA